MADINNYTLIDLDMTGALHLKGCALLLYSRIASLSEKGYVMFESEASLARRFGYRREHICRTLNKLVRMELIFRLEQRHQPGNTYCYTTSHKAVTIAHLHKCGNVTSGCDKMSSDNKEDSLTENRRDNYYDKYSFQGGEKSGRHSRVSNSQPGREFRGTDKF